MSPLRISLLVLLACDACDGCQPRLNPQENEDPEETDSEALDSGDSGDSADSQPPLDTAPEPPCDQPEVEPNGTFDEAMPIEVEKTACGVLYLEESELDLDYFTFEVEEGDWIKIDVDAASIGSRANPVIYVRDEDDELFYVERDGTTTDPLAVFPSYDMEEWMLLITDARQGSGEDYHYLFRVSVSKPPVEWDTLEEEDNNAFEDAQPITDGELVFGILESSSDVDNFRIDTPAGKSTVHVVVSSSSLGSPLEPRLVYSEPVLGDSGGVVDYEKVEADVGDSTDPFARLSITSEEAQTLYLTVREDDGRGGPYYWYTIEAEIETP